MGIPKDPIDYKFVRDIHHFFLRPDPLYEAIFTCTGNPVRSIGTQAAVTRDAETESPTFTIMNSFWFILAALLGQGVDILPR